MGKKLGEVSILDAECEALRVASDYRIDSIPIESESQLVINIQVVIHNL